MCIRDRIEPAHQDAYYLLAQQYFLSARFADARTAIERVIELATAPGMPLSAEALARYYYYKGRILDAAGDARNAGPQYRRALEYLSLIHISEPTRLLSISYAVFCLKK